MNLNQPLFSPIFAVPPRPAAAIFSPMKPLLPLLLLSAASLFAEPVTVRESVILKSERTILSIKPGTEVELVARDGDTVTIRYRNVTGKIPAGKLADAAKPAAAEAPKVVGKETLPAEAEKPSPPPPKSPPQTGYGKAVQKAKDNTAARDKNAVKPTDEILKE
jgi:hypothetical protein